MNRRQIVLALSEKGYRAKVIDRKDGEWTIGYCGENTPTQLFTANTIKEVLQKVAELPISKMN